MKKLFLLFTIMLVVAAFILVACKKSDSASTTTTTAAPDVYKKIYGATDIYVQDNFVVIKTKSLPDHKSPYYQGTQWASMYEAYNGANPNYVAIPNRIAESDLTFKIPLNPTTTFHVLQ